MHHLDRLREAIRHYEKLLELNTNDDQGALLAEPRILN
jgi:hypothetical protein